jgi:hypothetical protein
MDGLKMGKAIIALLCAPFELLRILVHFVVPPKTGKAGGGLSAEEERLDRIRNPHKYGPGRER